MDNKKIFLALLALSILIPFSYAAGTLYVCGPGGDCNVAQTTIPEDSTSSPISPIPSSSIPASCDTEGTYYLRAVYTGASNSPLNVDAYNINWDNNQAHCECYQGYGTYNPNADSQRRCCGDDNEDAGAMTSDNTLLCIPDNAENWVHKASPQTRPGDIFHIDYGNYDVVTDSENWYACNAAGNTGSFDGELKQEEDIFWIEGHQYLCYDYQGSGRFAECRGQYSSVNQGTATDSTRRKTSGDGITLASGSTYFCSQYAEWSEGIADQNTCIAAGFEWTGSRCCGIGGQEFYNDLNWDQTYSSSDQAGGCFKGTKIFHNRLISEGNALRNGDFSSQAGWDLSGAAILENNRLKIRGNSGSASQDLENAVSGAQYTISVGYMSSPGSCSAYIKIGNTELTSTGSRTFTMPSDSVIITGADNCGSNDNAFIDDISLTFDDPGILNYEGQFYGCSQDYPYSDQVNGGNLIDREDVCGIRGDFFCSPRGSWSDETQGAPNSSSRTQISSVPEGISRAVSISCCPTAWCWTGQECTQEEYNFGTDLPDEENWYGCIGGEWRPASQAEWTGQRGYCPQDTDCLVDSNGDPDSNYQPSAYAGSGNPANPVCVAQGQYVGDHICGDGEWASRTGFAAAELLKFVQEEVGSEDYTLYCDHYTEVLPAYQYSDIESYLKGDEYKPPFEQVTCGGIPFQCVNNFCILAFTEDDQQKRAVAVSLNKPVNDPQYSFLETLDKPIDYCSQTSDGFQRCSGDNTIWYSKDHDILIYSMEGIDSLPELESGDFQGFVKQPFFTDLLSKIAGFRTTTPLITQGYEFATDIKDFNRIYVDRIRNKQIKAVMEKPTPAYAGEQPPEGYPEFFAIKFQGVDSNICPTVLQFREQRQLYTTNCTFSDPLLGQTETYVVGAEEEILEMWPYLTSRIRLQE